MSWLTYLGCFQGHTPVSFWQAKMAHVLWEGCLCCVVGAALCGQVMGAPYSCLLAVTLMADLMAV